MLDTEYKMIAMIPRVRINRVRAWRINRNQRIQSISELRKLARKKNLDHSKINFVSIFIKTKYYVHESRCVQFINSFTLR